MDVVVRSVAADAVSAFDSLFVAGPAGMILALLLTRSQSLALLGVGAAVVAGPAVIRCLRISLRLDAEGVTVANYFRTRRLSWTEVAAIGWDRFEVPHASRPSIAFRRPDGETVISQAGWGLGRRRRERVVDVLKDTGRARGIACYLASDDLSVWVRRHVNEPLSVHPALPRVDRRLPVFRHHPSLGWVVVAAILAAIVLVPVTIRLLLGF